MGGIKTMTPSLKAREITTQDRVTVLEAALALGHVGDGWDIWRLTKVNRWAVQGIAGAAGWPNTAMVEQNLAAMRAVA